MNHDEWVQAVDRNPYFFADMVFIDKSARKEYEVSCFTGIIVKGRTTIKVSIKEVKKDA